MKKAVCCAFLVLFFACPLFAIDEDAYVRFVADSIVVTHKVKGDSNAAKLWSEEMKRTYPGITGQDLIAYEEMLARDSALKGKTYNRILENVRSRGYNAHISNLGTGATMVIIEG